MFRSCSQRRWRCTSLTISCLQRLPLGRAASPAAVDKFARRSRPRVRARQALCLSRESLGHALLDAHHAGNAAGVLVLAPVVPNAAPATHRAAAANFARDARRSPARARESGDRPRWGAATPTGPADCPSIFAVAARREERRSRPRPSGSARSGACDIPHGPLGHRLQNRDRLFMLAGTPCSAAVRDGR